VCEDPHEGLQQSQYRVANPAVPVVGGEQSGGGDSVEASAKPLSKEPFDPEVDAPPDPPPDPELGLLLELPELEGVSASATGEPPLAPLDPLPPVEPPDAPPRITPPVLPPPIDPSVDVAPDSASVCPGG
jgi:hypothetical protein